MESVNSLQNDSKTNKFKALEKSAPPHTYKIRLIDLFRLHLLKNGFIKPKDKEKLFESV